MSIPRENVVEVIGATARDGAIVTREGVIDIPEELALHHGGRLVGVRLAWRMSGPAAAPVVVALGGISAHRRVFVTGEPAAGWWNGIVGRGEALDADRFRILSFDFLGGSGDSTGPRPGGRFPAVSTYDQADLLLRLLNHLRIKALRAIVGASYGGMVALAFAERYPDRVERLVVIGAADRAHPLATAWRSVQRRIARLAASCDREAEGLAIARALGMTTYRSAEEFAARFGGEPERRGESFAFPVEDYLAARGRDYAACHSVEAFCCLSESIDLHRVDAARIFVPTVAVCVREDQLVPVGDVRALVARLPHGRLVELSSIYGHDAFLKEAEALRAVFRQALGGGT